LKYVGLFSGGKDSLVVCHYLWKQKKLNEVVHCRTGIGTHENLDYVKSTCSKFGWKLNIIEPKEGETYQDFVRKFGFPHEGMHSAIMGYLKWHPLRKFGRDNECIFVSGRRKKESKRRMRTVKHELEKVEKHMTFYSPLMDWTTPQVWQYIYDNKLEICPVYETLHMSGDCLCGAFAESGEAELIATFHTDLASKIKDLETKYGGMWGNGSSLTGALKQSKMTNFLCQECQWR